MRVIGQVMELTRMQFEVEEITKAKSKPMFRAKTTTKDNPKHAFNNAWVFGDVIHSGGKTYIHPACNKVNVINELGKTIIMHEVIPDTLCRYTDTSFITKEDFWEGDIIAYDNAIGVIRYGLFNSKYVGFFVEWQGRHHDMRNDLVYWIPKVDKIGNVFDNPELLKAGGCA